jgi:hypothetical protein
LHPEREAGVGSRGGTDSLGAGYKSRNLIQGGVKKPSRKPGDGSEGGEVRPWIPLSTTAITPYITPWKAAAARSAFSTSRLTHTGDQDISATIHSNFSLNQRLARSAWCAPNAQLRRCRSAQYGNTSQTIMGAVFSYHKIRSLIRIRSSALLHVRPYF